MFEHYSDRARSVVKAARNYAKSQLHLEVESEHLLYGLLETTGGVAHAVLINLNVNVKGLKYQLDSLMSPGSLPMGQTVPLGPKAQRIFELAQLEAHSMGVEYVGTEHLLLALMQVTEGKAQQLLSHRGIHLVQIREETLELTLGRQLSPVVDLSRVVNRFDNDHLAGTE